MEPGTIVNIFIAAVWIGFGLFCKVLGLVQRQLEIVARILGEPHAWAITKLIGLAEICMAVWILSGSLSRASAVLQIVVVAAMNIIEFTLARDLLLFGRLNAVFATVFIAIVFANEFVF